MRRVSAINTRRHTIKSKNTTFISMRIIASPIKERSAKLRLEKCTLFSKDLKNKIRPKLSKIFIKNSKLTKISSTILRKTNIIPV